LYNNQVPRADRNEAAKPQLKAFGSMTYAGLLAMLHCDLTREDPRVRSTYQYLGKHWTLDENPGQGNQGLYFYYDVLSRALTAANVEMLTLADGTAIDWREALALALLERQQPDGSWVNENNRFWEGDPALSTSYALLALQILLQQ
jgi:squalene-hopene/tetraprenyl-beta-curcumene cyclase